MNSTNQPLVTLRISAYNHEKYIKQAIMSLINQTYKNTEIIVIDDGSTDNTPNILKNLSKQYSFNFIRQENKGLPLTLNRIIGLAKGKYITGCASDDYMPLDKVEKQVSFLENNNGFAVCGGNAIVVDRDGTVISNKILEDKTFKIIRFEDVFLHDKSIPAGTAMIRKDILNIVGGYSPEYPIEDKYMWLRITSKGYKIARMNVTLQYYRQHDNNISKNSDFIIENSKKCLDIYKTHKLYPKAINNFYARTFNKYALINKHQSIAAFYKINWRLLNKESFKEICWGIFKYIKSQCK